MTVAGQTYGLPPADRLIPVSPDGRDREREIADIALTHPGSGRWWLAFAASLALIGVLLVSLGWLLWEGVGVWGNNIPVTWALDIVSYDWWIGIASGSLVISALFLLLGAEWRSAVNRITETTALLAAIAAAIYPIIHLGRPWFFFWTLPYPNSLLLWPQFRSPSGLGCDRHHRLPRDLPQLLVHGAATRSGGAEGSCGGACRRCRSYGLAEGPALRHRGDRLAWLGRALAALDPKPIACWRSLESC